MVAYSLAIFAHPPSTFWQDPACSRAEPSPGFTAKIVEPIDISDYDFTDVSNSKSTFNNNEIDHLVDKNILTKTVDNRYSMILSHKLFPNMKKSSENKILINDIDDRYFISRFVFDYDAPNQSGKKLYSTVKLFHMYKFLKI